MIKNLHSKCLSFSSIIKAKAKQAIYHFSFLPCWDRSFCCLLGIASFFPPQSDSPSALPFGNTKQSSTIISTFLAELPFCGSRGPPWSSTGFLLHVKAARTLLLSVVSTHLITSETYQKLICIQLPKVYSQRKKLLRKALISSLGNWNGLPRNKSDRFLFTLFLRQQVNPKERGIILANCSIMNKKLFLVYAYV